LPHTGLQRHQESIKDFEDAMHILKQLKREVKKEIKRRKN